MKCNNILTPGPDKLFWRHIKKIAQNDMCFQNIINIADACIDLGHWPSHFKISLSIIIPKPNKVLYDSTKTFRPIVLLNTLGKLIKKVISNRLQFQSILKNLIHSLSRSKKIDLIYFIFLFIFIFFSIYFSTFYF